MNDQPRQQLHAIIAKYGVNLCGEPRRCENLLRDFCPRYPREVTVLAAALKKKIPNSILSAPPSRELLDKLAAKLQAELALEQTAARWAVESWAAVLGKTPREPSVAPALSPTVRVSDDPFDGEPMLSPEEQLRLALQAALADGIIDSVEKAQLQALRDRLGVPEALARQILSEEQLRRKGR